MINCPRCSLPQDESPQCQYCGLIFEEFREESSRAPQTGRSKRIALLAVILAVSGALLASYWFSNFRAKSSKKSTTISSSSSVAQSKDTDDLRKKVKELTSFDGIISDLAGGSTKGSIVAMVVFSIIGLGYLTFGKKSQQLLMVVCGIALMGYSYFLSGTVYIILIGIGLSMLPLIFGRN